MRVLPGRPGFNAEDAAALASALFGAQGSAAELVSERDQNFLIDTGTARFVLKIANSNEAHDALELQRALLDRLQDTRYMVSESLHAPDGNTIVVASHGGAEYFVRLLTWVPGTPLEAVRPHTRDLRHQLGALAGHVSAAFAGFEHPAARRHLKWDLEHAPERIRSRLELIASGKRRALLNATLERFEQRTAPLLDDLRRGVIHNDINDHNVLTGELTLRDGWPERHITGLIDVGDALHGWVVTDLATAIAYAILGCDDVISVSRTITAGYHEVFPLEDAEIAALTGLVSLRLALSVANSAAQAAAEPDNDYLTVSETRAWVAIERLAAIDPTLATGHLRDACGLEACANGAALRDWLQSTDQVFANVADAPLAGEDVHVFDLGVGSTEMGVGAPGDFVTADLSEMLFGQMRAAGKSVGLGRYDEVRSWYGGELFAAPSNEAPGRRTVHIGIDVFLEPGAAVYAPLAGTVVSAALNEGRLDYGPTLILEHEPTPGLKFWSLYGHLTADSLSDTAPGQRVASGQRIAAIGDYPVNGDWPPHLHFQLIADRLDHDTDFPGVCAPADRAVWKSLSPDPARILGLDEGQVAPVGMGADAIANRRQWLIGPSLSISYRRPLTIVRGYRQVLYDVEGQPLLDAVNNVPHVGHSHPHVVAAAAAQNAVLSTNTRYLHENIVRYAERLIARMPDPLEVCYFVCSGSEANELAIRLARTATARYDVVALDGAYHGNTSTLIDISSYKHDGPGGRGAPNWAHIATLPDPYRGEFAGKPDAGSRYAEDVRRCCVEAESSGGVAAIMAEPLLGCGGQIVPPPGYLSAAFEHVRAAGGLCIADEVQVGFGRVGSHFWAFETHDVVPDIVTLGKPIGNGFPLAAVITTRKIADAFANGMEYFNTFGGNPVACAVGNAVLDVIEDENLQANALEVGNRLLEGLGEIATRHPIVGNVRGVGLYIGAEMVRNSNRLEPAAAEASYVINRMRDHGILISTDGPLHNVLKLKPPLCFGLADAERFLHTLDQVLGEDFVS